MEYEAARHAVRRHQLPVRGAAIRRGLLVAGDRPRSNIDVHRLPDEHTLARYHDRAPTRTHIRTRSDVEDSLDGDDGRCEGSSNSTSAGSGSRLSLKSTSGSKHRLRGAGSRHSGSGRNGQSLPSSFGFEIGDGDRQASEEEEGEDSDIEVGGDAARWSTRTTGRLTQLPLRRDRAWRRMLWEHEEELARRNAVSWPGRASNVVYRPEGQRGGHPIFERVGQTWLNDDPRYLADRSDEEVMNRYRCRQSAQLEKSCWKWKKTAEYSAIGPSTVYRCVPVNDQCTSPQKQPISTFTFDQWESI